MKTLTRNAYAKVNLALDVLRRREDGYHDVCMIMQNLSLYDTLTFTVEEADTLTITLACDKKHHTIKEIQKWITTNWH